MLINDTERVDFIQRMLNENGTGEGVGVTIEKNTLIGSQPNQKDLPVQIFSVPSQHQRAGSVREVIDIAMQFESGERDWEKENWG